MRLPSPVPPPDDDRTMAKFDPSTLGFAHQGRRSDSLEPVPSGGMPRALREAAIEAGMDPVSELFNEALAFAKENHLQLAEERLRVLLCIAPDDGEARLLLAQVYVADRRWQDALDAIEEARKYGAEAPRPFRRSVEEQLLAEQAFEEERSAAVSARNEGEAAALRGQVHRLREENEALANRSRQLHREVRKWTWATLAVSVLGVSCVAGLLVWGSMAEDLEPRIVEASAHPAIAPPDRVRTPPAPADGLDRADPIAPLVDVGPPNAGDPALGADPTGSERTPGDPVLGALAIDPPVATEPPDGAERPEAVAPPQGGDPVGSGDPVGGSDPTATDERPAAGDPPTADPPVVVQPPATVAPPGPVDPPVPGARSVVQAAVDLIERTPDMTGVEARLRLGKDGVLIITGTVTNYLQRKKMERMLEEQIEGVDEVDASKMVALSRRDGGTHIVGRGETLSHVAYAFYGNSMLTEPIEARNKVTPESLRPGMKLVVPPQPL